MMPYGESDYWVAQYRSRTEASAQQQVHLAEDPRRSWVVRGATIVKALFGSLARSGVEKKADLNGRA